MTDYANGKIYKIICNDIGKVYIGSTTKSLKERLNRHKNNYKDFCEEKDHYVTSFEIIKNYNYEIELLEIYPCNSKRELETRERYYIENTECVNKTIPTRTKQEYDKIHSEENKAKIQKYRDENKEKILNGNKNYHEKNRKILLNNMKKYYEDNKEKYKKKTECYLCGKMVCKRTLKVHQKTYRCIDIYMNRQD